MKRTVRIICALLALAALFALASCRKRDGSVPEGYKLAGAAENGGEDKSEAKDYYLYVPASWTVDINNTATSAFVSASDPASVSVMTWTVSVTDATPEECFDTSIADFEKVYADFKVESRESMKLDGIDALSVVFTGSLGGGEATLAEPSGSEAASDTGAEDVTAAQSGSASTDAAAQSGEASTDAATDASAPAATSPKAAGAADDGADHFRFCQVLAVKDSLVYVITYTNLADRFDEHTQDFNDIIGYFKFK